MLTESNAFKIPRYLIKQLIKCRRGYSLILSLAASKIKVQALKIILKNSCIMRYCIKLFKHISRVLGEYILFFRALKYSMSIMVSDNYFDIKDITKNV